MDKTEKWEDQFIERFCEPVFEQNTQQFQKEDAYWLRNIPVREVLEFIEELLENRK